MASIKLKQLGSSGLRVPELCVGCMSFGDPARGGHSWTLDEAQSCALIRQAFEAGLTFFDTANIYSDGSSEEILGNVLWDLAPRHEIILATKVWGDARPERQGLSRRLIFQQLDASLKRLKTDHVDLYQIHRWDAGTPIEETMEALHDTVKAGKVRYLGASTMYAWQFAKAQEAARRHGWTRFISMQNQLNLIYREEEREMIPLCRDQGVGLIPWSPMARGRLARPRGGGTARSASDQYQKKLYDRTEAQDGLIIDEVAAVARDVGRSMAQVALAWVRQTPGVAAPIIGFTRAGQLAEAIAGLDLVLAPDHIARLEAPYVPHVVADH